MEKSYPLQRKLGKKMPKAIRSLVNSKAPPEFSQKLLLQKLK